MELTLIDYLYLWIVIVATFGTLFKCVIWFSKITIKTQAKKLALNTGVTDVFVRHPNGAIQCVYSDGKFQERVYTTREFANLFQKSNE